MKIPVDIQAEVRYGGLRRHDGRKPDMDSRLDAAKLDAWITREPPPEMDESEEEECADHGPLSENEDGELRCYACLEEDALERQAEARFDAMWGADDFDRDLY